MKFELEGNNFPSYDCMYISKCRLKMGKVQVRGPELNNDIEGINQERINH